MIPEDNDPKIAWNSKRVDYKRLDLLNSGCTVFFWKSPTVPLGSSYEKVNFDQILTLMEIINRSSRGSSNSENIRKLSIITGLKRQRFDFNATFIKGSNPPG